MKKTLQLTFAFQILIFGSKVHAIEQNNWYLGAVSSTQDITALPDREHKTAGVVAGYQYNKFFSLEARFNKGTSGYSSAVSNIEDSSYTEYKEDIDTQAMLFLKATYPVFNSLNIYVLAGISKSKYEITRSHTIGTTTSYAPEVNYSKNGFTYGLGLNYKVTDEFNVFFDYKILPELTQLTIYSGDSPSWESASLGISYAF